MVGMGGKCRIFVPSSRPAAYRASEAASTDTWGIDKGRDGGSEGSVGGNEEEVMWGKQATNSYLLCRGREHAENALLRTALGHYVHTTGENSIIVVTR